MSLEHRHNRVLTNESDIDLIPYYGAITERLWMDPSTTNQ